MQQMEEEEQQEQLQNLGSLFVFQKIRETQRNYGLQHGDYQRYRTYCYNKINKLRHQMQFTHGKRFQKKVIQDVVKNDPRVLQVLLYQAEKNWAHAMTLKQLINSGVNKKINKRQVKVYLVKKFKRAIQYSKQLTTICELRTEKRTSLESEAYNWYLQGLYHFETEKWEKALESFAKCYTIYEQIIKVCDQFSSGVYQERLEQLNQQIRYCNAKAKKLATLSADELTKMLKDQSDPIMIAKFEEMLEEQRQAKMTQQQGAFEIDYQDSKLPIKNEKVVKLILKIQESKLIGDLDSFTTLFSLYDEASKYVKIDKDQSTSEQEKEIHSKVLGYINYQRQSATLDRNEMHIRQYTEKFIKEDGVNNLQNLQTKKALKLKLTTPQEIIKYCDNYSQILRQIMDEERFNKDITLFKILDAKEFFCKALRCFFVGCLYFTNEKYREAYSLLKYHDDLSRIADRKYIENKLEPHSLLKLLVPLSTQIQNKSKLNGLKLQQDQVKTIGQEIQNIGLEDKQNQKTLFELLDSPEQITLDNVLSYKPADLISLMQPIPPKPIQLDIAHSYLTYPTLEEPKKGGFWGKLNIFKKQ
ncbi:unnamed protein product (macronuclear) [Paramecium tetraurelia]|uniref:Signal recognition particle subunit SRP68 n=1 Tax=Paramecium tetraurelia TaxID=5888 RepID=A0DUQ8_PARTE|nr:uncharacterized protein GSPATT00020447001 [Paramecium tetraurelia]CAK86775.1 unnamed protein product [Paramecium tetraurelia]|eukprot:XP_001454172.1 hypothetical protein (macronuclear) [Paramecium tetraurelia strain d4-2]